MNKRELLKEIRIRARITNVESAAFLEAFCGLVGEQLASCGELSIHGFGKFRATKIKSRMGRIFGNEKARKIPAYHQIRFKSFSALSAKI
jgi:nucleoid DNA-binding protein